MRTNVEVVSTICYRKLHNILDFRKPLFILYLFFLEIFRQFRTLRSMLH